MIAVTFRPLPVWPHPTAKRRVAPFTATWSSTMADLDHELRQLKADRVVVGAGFSEADLRRDGMPRAGAPRPPHPGVELSFDCAHGRLVYGTDVYDEWQDNVRAITLGLRALRAVDRYGITRGGEQYAGWKQLPAGSNGNGPTARGQAAHLIGQHSGRDVDAVLADDDALRVAYRLARGNTHPDRSGGDSAAFLALEQAGRVLGLVR